MNLTSNPVGEFGGDAVINALGRNAVLTVIMDDPDGELMQPGTWARFRNAMDLAPEHREYVESACRFWFELDGSEQAERDDCEALPRLIDPDLATELDQATVAAPHRVLAATFSGRVLDALLRAGIEAFVPLGELRELLGATALTPTDGPHDRDHGSSIVAARVLGSNGVETLKVLCRRAVRRSVRGATISGLAGLPCAKQRHLSIFLSYGGPFFAVQQQL